MARLRRGLAGAADMPRRGSRNRTGHMHSEARYSQYRGIELAGLQVAAIRIERVTSLENLSVEPAAVSS